jgi:hypothetical protein
MLALSAFFMFPKPKAQEMTKEQEFEELKSGCTAKVC